MNQRKHKYTTQFETWWTEVGNKVCRFDKPWFIEESKYVASIAFEDGKAVKQIEEKKQ